MNDPRRRILFRGQQDRPRVAGGDALRRLDRRARSDPPSRGRSPCCRSSTDRHICLVRNERYAVGKTLLEVPAGTIDEGESPDETAIRELSEETGYSPGRSPDRRWWVSPGVFNERMYLYLCEDLAAGTDRPPAR